MNIVLTISYKQFHTNCHLLSVLSGVLYKAIVQESRIESWM